MSLYKRAGSEYWWMDVYRGRGKRRLRASTKKKNRIEAELVERAFVSASAGTSDRDRMRAMVDIMFDAERPELELKSLGEWYRAATIDDGARVSKKTLEARINLCGRLYEWARAETRAAKVGDVTVAVAWRFSQAIGSQTSAKSRNAYMSELGTVWKILIKRSEAKENPWANVKVGKNAEEERHGRAFTPEEEARIFAAAQEVGHGWYGACLVARYTGFRQGDVFGLRASQIADGWIYAKPGKTKRHNIKVAVPVHPKLKAWLEERLKRQEPGESEPVAGREALLPGDRWLIPEKAKPNPGGKWHRGDCKFSEILKRAKVGEKQEEAYLSFHCWRHTFDTRLSEAGVSQDTRMAMTGHRVAETETIYNHDTARFEAAIASMG